MSSATPDVWETYSRANEINPAQRHRSRLILAQATARAVATDAVVVDLGCGSGILLGRLSSALPRVRRVGFDVSPAALALARRNDPDAEFLQLDLQDPSAEIPAHLAGRASLVLCSEVLEHLERPQVAVAHAARLLAPGGRFVITVPAGAMTAFDQSIGHQRHYTVASATALLEDAGLRVERAFRWGFPFHSLFRMALGIAPGVTSCYRDDRLSLPARMLSDLLYWLFYLNVEHRRLGRQIVAVANPR